MSLKEIAISMKHEAAKGQVSQRILSGGLILTLRKDGPAWHLSLTRYGEPPSPKEQVIIRNCFEIPKGTAGKKDREGGYHLVRLTWGPEEKKEPETRQGRLL